MTDTTSNEVKFLREKLARHLAGYRNRRVRYRNLAFLLKMGTTFFGSATTILLGLKGYSSFSAHAESLSVAALISSAAVTLAATWETFFDHRWLWVRFTAAFERLTEISDDLEYALAKGNFSDNQVDLYYDRLKATLQETRSAWFEKRVREIGTDR
jgi:hypothetical protein